MNLTAEQVKNLNILANFMDGLNDPKFTMRKVFHGCGTPACAFGYALVHPYFKAKGLIDHRTISRPMFGPEAFDTLFYVYFVKTPQQWAAHCRAFLKSNGYEVSDGFKTFMDRVMVPVQFCPESVQMRCQ